MFTCCSINFQFIIEKQKIIISWKNNNDHSCAKLFGHGEIILLVILLTRLNNSNVMIYFIDSQNQWFYGRRIDFNWFKIVYYLAQTYQ